jgi:hypothetical protein
MATAVYILRNNTDMVVAIKYQLKVKVRDSIYGYKTLIINLWIKIVFL